MIELPICTNCKVLSESYFNILDKPDLIDLSIAKTASLYSKGQTVFFEGKTPTGIYCLNSGKVKIFKSGIDGKEQIVRIVTPGNFIGIRSLLGNQNYSASATTLEDSFICFINKQVFFHLLKKYPRLSKQLMVNLSQLLMEAEDKITSLAQKPVRERLAETLIILNKVFFHDKIDVNNSFSLSREDLANIVGTATETVIRLLTEFKNENLITTKGRKITIVDIKGLRKISHVF